MRETRGEEVSDGGFKKQPESREGAGINAFA